MDGWIKLDEWTDWFVCLHLLGHEIPHELRGEGLGALHVHVVPTGAGAIACGGAAAHEERGRLVAAGAVRQAKRERHAAVAGGEGEGLRAELMMPVRRGLPEQRVPAAVLVVVPAPAAPPLSMNFMRSSR